MSDGSVRNEVHNQVPAYFGVMRDISHDAIELFEQKRTRGQTIIAAASLAITCYATVKTVRQRKRDNEVFQVTVPQNDAVYRSLHRWVLEQMPAEDRKALTVLTARQREYDDDETRSVHLFYDGSRSQNVTIDGHRVSVVVEKSERGGGVGEFEMPSRRNWDPEKIRFTCRSEVARDAILALIKTLANELQEQRVPRLYTATSWGEWRQASNAPARPLDTVVLADGLRETIVSDLEHFLSLEAEYATLGIPWHRGYLLYGPPGTGKTSMAASLAHHLKMDVHYIGIPSIKDDETLATMFNAVDEKSILLLEDIDVAHATKVRDDEKPGVTLSGLLNALDGFITPHGLVTIMTTNNRDVLDEALVRPGRVDLELELSYLDDDQLRRLCAALLPAEQPYTPPALPQGAELTPAEVVGVVKQSLHGADPRQDLDALILGDLHVPVEGFAPYSARSGTRGATPGSLTARRLLGRAIRMDD